MSLTVEDSGLSSLLQDQGRPGLGALGVTTSGAFDRSALRQANALLGNTPGAAVIEVLAGGLVLRADAAHTIAVTGGVGTLTIDGSPIAHGRAVPLRPGQRLALGRITAGLRSYVGVAGGLAGTAVLGSLSTDTLSGLGPPRLAAGDSIDVGVAPAAADLADIPSLLTIGDLTVDVILGPRDDWFTPPAVRTLLETPWRVGAASDRIGIRLDGPELTRSRLGELPSEPCVRGSIQVAADGRPIIFGPDHPVTGGYPVIAVVMDTHTDRLAQAEPGRVLRFRARPV